MCVAHVSPMPVMPLTEEVNTTEPRASTTASMHAATVSADAPKLKANCALKASIGSLPGSLACVL